MGEKYNYTYKGNKHALDKENRPHMLLNATSDIKMHPVPRSSKIRRQVYEYM